MNRNCFPKVARSLLAAASFIMLGSANADAQSEIVLHTKNASHTSGDWQLVADNSAASGSRIYNPERGRAKLTAALAAPTDFFELTFNAEAGRAYHFWMRGKADGDYYANDSVFLQFSGSVTSGGSAVYRIGTTSALWAGIEACSGCGLGAWGWEDNSYGGLGSPLYFATTGPQTIRIQRREDGISIDQIVLSSSSYQAGPPGLTKYDNLILAPTSSTTTSTPTTSTPTTSTPTTTTPTTTTTGSTSEIVLTTAHVTTARGNWRTVADSTAAGGTRYWNPDGGQPKLGSAYASPTDYVDLTFTAEAGKAYRLWLRGKAENNFYGNDSVFVQFSGSLTSGGSAAYRIGTSDATVVSIENCSACGVSGWGWTDNGYDGWGPLIYFASSGTQTMRIQRREDGASFDQVVLSSSKYLNSSPGAAKNDSTILTGSTTTEPAPAPAPEPAPAPAPSPTGGVRIRVLQWNLHHGVGTDGSYNLDRIATWMAAMRPDVVLLNEVERYTYWGNEDQPARYKALLQAKTGRTYYSHFSQEFGQWSSNGKGHLILSVFPFDSATHTTITGSSGLGGGGVASQAGMTINGRAVNFVLTHLDPYDPNMRLIQARDVIRWASGFSENRIVTGDMNAWNDQASIQEYYKYYNDSWLLALANGQAYASSSISPYGATKNGRIDYILPSRWASNLVVIDSQVYDTRDSSGHMPSDHRPVVTTFEVR